jgi:hypothetical protein
MSGTPEADHTSTSGLVSCGDLYLLYINTGGDITSVDGGTTDSVLDINLARNTLYRAALWFGPLTSNVAKKAIGGGVPGSIAWQAAVNYDGAYAFTTAMKLAYAISYPQKIKKVWLFNRVLTTDEINALR